MRIDFGQIQEIRLRVNQPVKAFCGRERTPPFRYGEREMEEVFRYLCHDSVYAYEEERKQGYIMVEEDTASVLRENLQRRRMDASSQNTSVI